MTIGTTRDFGRTAALVALLFALPCVAVGQTAEGDPVDVAFEVVNATTGEPGTVSRLTIDYVTVQPNTVADFAPSGSAFTAPAIPVIDSSAYIITVWKDGVPYWWSKRGRDLKAGPVVLHVFDTAPGPEGLAISGLDVILKHAGSLLEIQYLVRIRNDLSPQATVFGGGPALALALPSGARDVEATYMRGPDPMPVEIKQSGGMAGLVFPVTPGANQVRIEAVMPFTDGMTYEVGANLPVDAWSLLAAPAGIEIRGYGVRATTDQNVPGYTRFTTDPIDAGDRVELTLIHAAPGGGDAEDLFEKVAEAQQEPAAADGDTGGSPNYLPLIFLGGLLIVILIGAARRRKD